MNDDSTGVKSLLNFKEKFGKIREQCQVWIHQFRREPDREFSLQLGDVTFFGFVGDPTAEDIARARKFDQ